ncbi:MAG: SDR family NAD(P)-dependent oxidoreductase [Myxococcota bacterium]
MTSQRGSAVVLGVGAQRGVGGAACRRYGREGLHVFAVGRTAEKVERVAKEVVEAGGEATPIVADATIEADVVRALDQAQAARPLELVHYNAGNNRWSPLLEMESGFFEDVWRLCCLGGFMVGREAARRMVSAQRGGSIFFTGATASLRGRPPFTAFASAKAGLRAVAQAMARELGPQGIHVAHVVIDGVIHGEVVESKVPGYIESKGPDGALAPDAIADAFWLLHTQHRSAWTHELDLRPFKEPW